MPPIGIYIQSASDSKRLLCRASIIRIRNSELTMQDEMCCQARVLVRWIIGISEQKSVRLSGNPDGRFSWTSVVGEIYPRIELTYGPSDHVKTWLKPHDSTSFSASSLGLGIVFATRVS